MEPINYMLDIQSPIQQALKGYGLGRQEIEQTQIMQEREQMMGLREAAEARAASEFEMRRAEAERQRAQAEAMQTQLMQLRQGVLDGTLTSEDINKFAIANANTFDELSAATEQLAKPVRDAATSFGSQLATSLLRGNTDVSVSRLDERIAALENEGSPQSLEEAGKLKALREEALIDPQGAGLSILTGLRVQGLIDSTAMDAILKAAGQGKAAPEGASPLGKIAQDVEAGLIPKSVLDAAIKLETQTSEGTLTLQQKIAEEARLRGEYAKRTEDLSAAERNFSIIETSSMDQSGAGDIALVTSFMKMLDPGSVVRETEFATAANAGGLLAKLNSIAKKVETGQFLSEQQRADFKRLAGEYLNAAKVQEQGVQQSFNLIVDNYGLDPVNVFGARAATAPAPGGETGALPQSFLTNPNVTNAATAAGVTPEDMWNVMTPEQRARYGG